MTKSKKKQGAASMYTVIFTTMVLSIIALSFVRIILGENIRTQNESLSQSAYNSALAGVEDGKVLIMKYQECLNTYGSATASGISSECERILKYFELGQLPSEIDECDTVRYLLYNESDSGETKLSDDSTSGDGLSQAYTCVRIFNKVRNYVRRSEDNLNSIMVPIYIDESDGDSIDSLDAISVYWFKQGVYDDMVTNSTHPVKESSDSSMSMASDGADLNKMHHRFSDAATIASPIRVDIMQAGQQFKMDDFYSSANVGGELRTNRASILLYPGENTDDFTVTADAVAASAAKAQNYPTSANCTGGDHDGYHCMAKIGIPKAYNVNGSNVAATDRNKSGVLLNISFPYGIPENVDFEIRFLSGAKQLNLRNVQYLIDSTGRANDLYRRVEARIDPRSENRYGPEYELQVGSASGSTAGIEKKIKITSECFIQTNGGEERKTGDGVTNDTHCDDGEEK